ncbi:MAG: very short patch repair endonuclease [Alphaproteobacteria bacterium]|nr:very short patch repair endonuclease [Alphaproteobacteria bacterium]
MSKIRGKNTKPEMAARSILHSNGFRYALHKKELPGSPDIVFSKYKTVAFINGCFWHGHSCSLGRMPTSNSDFWYAKITQTKLRDAAAIAALKTDGWRVYVVWECSFLKDLQKLLRFLNRQRKYFSS